MDTAVWLGESNKVADQNEPAIGQSSIAHQTIEVLRDFELLDDIIVTKAGLVVYSTKLIAD